MIENSNRILIVEDTLDTIRMLSTMLADAGYQALVATTGEKALERVEVMQPELILLDILLPGANGYDICREFKAREATRTIPVIFMSALHEPFYQLQRELEHTVDTLRHVQADLIRSEKMAVLGSLVAGVAHELNTPIGICVTATSYLDQQTHELQMLYHDEHLKRSDLEAFLSQVNESVRLLQMNLRRVADQIQAFKQVAVEQTVLEKRRFPLKLQGFLKNLGNPCL